MKTNNDPPKHMFPLLISLRVHQLIQGSIFYDVFLDTATGQFLKIVPDGEKVIKSFLINEAGWSNDTYQTSFSCFAGYIKEFKNPIYQHTIFSIVSHWDWYISNLAKFIVFAKARLIPNEEVSKELLKLNTKPFLKQIEIIKKETGIILEQNDDILNLVEEMHLVRNIGMHNEWEIDEVYIKYSQNKAALLGEKRQLEIDEIKKWHSAVLKLIDSLTSEISILYANAPSFEL